MTAQTERISEGYMKTYSTIPDGYIEDGSLAFKHLYGHRRQFQPGDTENERAWFETHREELERAYGVDRVNKLFDEIF